MYVQEYFKPGDYVSLIPIGLPVTLQYNISGNLEKVYIGYDKNRRDVTETFCQVLLERRYVPVKISITKGTTWVYGILYTADVPTKVSGHLPECAVSALETKFISNPEQFRFFAGNIECTSLRFMGSSHTTQYLHLCKFNVLPGWIVPPVMNKSVFDKWINATNYTFCQIVTDYIIFSKEKTEIKSTHISQHVIKTFKPYVDDNGYYRFAATYEDDSIKYMPYSEAAKYGLCNEMTVYIDHKSNIFSAAGYATEYSDTIKCPFCGKLYPANMTFGEETICPDTHCTSRLVSPIQRFLAVMGMPAMALGDIKKALKQGELTCIPDIFIIEPYSSMTINATIGKILQAMISVSYIKTPDIYSLFTTACSNDIKTIKYYINNPDTITTDLKINHPDINKLIAWLSDNCNASDLTTIIDSEQINIQQSDKFFDGAPIFRNKLIYITGDFIHGTVAEISAILQSYSARVTTVYTDTVDCVLIGGTNEGVNGKNIVSAKNMGIPVIMEQDFFSQYDIDTDLAQIV